MKKFYIFILFLVSLHGFSQNSACQFSDGNYHYKVHLIMDTTPPIDFSKTDFISYLETNSAISASDVQFLNENVIDLFRAYPNSEIEGQQRMLYVTSVNDSLDTLLSTYTESIDFTIAFCDCVFSSGFYNYYSKLVMDDIPALDFNKDDYIQYIELNSDISSDDVAFLNSTITEVYKTFPASSSENLQQALTIVSSSDILTPFLHDYLQAVDFTELLCDEPELSIDDLNLEDNIKIIPNPVIDNFVILIDNSIEIEEMLICDFTGKTIMRKNISGLNNIPINNYGLESGIYFLKFTTEKNSTVKKVIVQK
ncbi:MAG: T9SS type A sorting domain-containing protein [Gelidibacter sp.]